MLDDHEISIIKGMLKRGDRQSDIAAYFGCNGGRVAEINRGQRGADVRTATEGLPRPGPYHVSVRAYDVAIDALKAASELLILAKQDIEKAQNND